MTITPTTTLTPMPGAVRTGAALMAIAAAGFIAAIPAVTRELTTVDGKAISPRNDSRDPR